MSQFFFESMMSEDIPEILKMLQADKMALVLLSDELMVLRQTDKAALLLGTGIFHSVEGILSSDTCSAIRLCIDNRTDQTVTELLDDDRYSVQIHPVKGGVILYFSLIDSSKTNAALFSLNQNQKMRDSITLILIAMNNMKHQPLDEKGQSYVGIVRQNSLRLLRYLEHSSALRSPLYHEEMVFCAGDISDLFQQITEEISRFFPDLSVPITLDCPPRLHAVFDPTQITIAIYNLICNALKYGGPNVKIILRSELKENNVYLSVVDNGPGMTDEAIERSCGDLRSNKEEANQSCDSSCDWGLGIPLARKIAACHSGVLFISSKHSKGTTVTIAFPANLVADKILNQSAPAFSSNGFKAADIELSTFLSYEFYK